MLKLKIVNNRDAEEYYGDLPLNGSFPPSAYRHLVEKIASYYKIGAKVTIIVNPDVYEGNIF